MKILEAITDKFLTKEDEEKLELLYEDEREGNIFLVILGLIPAAALAVTALLFAAGLL